VAPLAGRSEKSVAPNNPADKRPPARDATTRDRDNECDPGAHGVILVQLLRPRARQRPHKECPGPGDLASYPKPLALHHDRTELPHNSDSAAALNRRLTRRHTDQNFSNRSL